MNENRYLVPYGGDSDLSLFDKNGSSQIQQEKDNAHSHTKTGVILFWAAEYVAKQLCC